MASAKARRTRLRTGQGRTIPIETSYPTTKVDKMTTLVEFRPMQGNPVWVNTGQIVKVIDNSNTFTVYLTDGTELVMGEKISSLQMRRNRQQIDLP